VIARGRRRRQARRVAPSSTAASGFRRARGSAATGSRRPPPPRAAAGHRARRRRQRPRRRRRGGARPLRPPPARGVALDAAPDPQARPPRSASTRSPDRSWRRPHERSGCAWAWPCRTGATGDAPPSGRSSGRRAERGIARSGRDPPGGGTRPRAGAALLRDGARGGSDGRGARGGALGDRRRWRGAKDAPKNDLSVCIPPVGRPAAYLLARLPRRSKATPWSLAAGALAGSARRIGRKRSSRSSVRPKPCPASTVTDNGTGPAGLGECVASAVRRWQFPAPEGGGAVTVNYPFDLSVVEP